MSYEMMMYVGLGAGAGFLLLAILLFFLLKIPAVISELTGRTARREIEAILSREQNEDGGAPNSKKTQKLRGGDNTVALNSGQSTGGWGKRDGDVLNQSTGIRRSTQRLDALEPNQDRRAETSFGPAVYIEDRILIIHTDELIGEW